VFGGLLVAKSKPEQREVVSKPARQKRMDGIKEHVHSSYRKGPVWLPSARLVSALLQSRNKLEQRARTKSDADAVLMGL